MADKYDFANVFYKIINRELPAKIVYEDEWIMAFHDINPVSPIHVLIIPKSHYIDFADFTTKASAFEIAHFFQKVNEIAKQMDTNNEFRLITNNGKLVGQEVFHFHVHLIAGKKLNNLI